MERIYKKITDLYEAMILHKNSLDCDLEENYKELFNRLLQLERETTFSLGKTRLYSVVDTEMNRICRMTLDEILYEINRDRSEEFIEYTAEDWREGLEEFTDYIVINDSGIEEAYHLCYQR